MTTTDILTGIGTELSVIDNSNGPLGTTNIAAQAAAAAAAAKAFASPSPGTGLAAITTSLAAIDTGLLVLQADYDKGNNSSVNGDLLALTGDASIIAGVYAYNIPGGQYIGKASEFLGSAAVIGGMYYSTSVNELGTEISDEIAFLNGQVGTAPVVTSATGVALGKIFYEITGLASDASDGLGNSLLSLKNQVSALQTSIDNYFSGTGDTAPNVTDTVGTGNGFTITSSNGSLSGTTGTFSSGSGASTTLDTAGNTGGGNINQTYAVGSNGILTETVQGFNTNGTTEFTQIITTPTTGQISSSITGTGDTADLSNAAISIGANAAAAVAGDANAIAAALGAQVSLTAGSTGDTVNVNGTGASVNISGAAVNTDTAIVSGTQEKLGFGGDMVTLAQGGSATVTGTNGTLAAVNDVGGNGVVSNTINLSAGGSSLQQLSGLASYLTEQESDYLGAHLTGTEHDVIDTYNTPISIYSSGSSIETILSGLSSGVANQNVYFSGGNGTGTNYQTNTNFTAGNSAVEFFNPSSSILNQTNDTTGLNGTGTDTFNTINWTLGGSQGQQLTGLGNGITDEESDYLGQSLTGTKHDVIDTFSTPIGGYSTGSSIETVLSGLVNGVANLEEYFSKANATGTNYQTNTNYQAGNSVVVFFNPTTSILTQVDDTTGLNGTGTDTQNTLNWNAGGSQVQLLTGLSSGVTLESKDYQGANGTSTENDAIFTYNVPIGPYASGSSIESVFGLPSLLTAENVYLSGRNGTGTMYQVNQNFTDGHSQAEFLNPSSSISGQWDEFASPGTTGTNYEDVLNNTNSTSQDQLYTNLAAHLLEVQKNFSQQDLTGTLNSQTDIAQSGTAIVNADGATIENISFGSSGAFLGYFYSGSTYLGLGAFYANGTCYLSENASGVQNTAFENAGGLGASDGAGSGGDTTFVDNGDGGSVYLGGGGEDTAAVAAGRASLPTPVNNTASAGGSATLKDNESLSVTDNAGTLSVASHDTLSVAAGSVANNITLSGADSRLVDDGLGDRIAVNGDSDSVNIAGNASPDVTGSFVTYGGTVEQITFAGRDTVSVANGVLTTIIGADGTLTASNLPGARTNTIEWNGGGSEIQIFTLPTNGAAIETDTGYSGSNGSGTALYQQVTTTSAGGAISSTISGAGATSALNNAAITMAASAGATLTGGGDTVAAGNNGSLAINQGFANAVTVSGKDASVSDTITSAGNTFILKGTGDSAALNGGNDSVTLGGKSNTATIGAGATTGTAVISGTDDTLAIAGTSSEHVTFDLNALGTLLFQSTQRFSGTVAGLAEGDHIDLAEFMFSGTPTISKVTGTGAAGTDTVLTITDAAITTQIALLNQYANQFGVNASAYTLTADGTQPHAGTLLQLAAGH